MLCEFQISILIYAGPNLLPLKVKFYNMIKCTLHPGVSREENGISSKSATPSLVEHSLWPGCQTWVASAVCSQLAEGSLCSQNVALIASLKCKSLLPFAPHLCSPWQSAGSSVLCAHTLLSVPLSNWVICGLTDF